MSFFNYLKSSMTPGVPPVEKIKSTVVDAKNNVSTFVSEGGIPENKWEIDLELRNIESGTFRWKIYEKYFNGTRYAPASYEGKVEGTSESKEWAIHDAKESIKKIEIQREKDLKEVAIRKAAAETIKL